MISTQNRPTILGSYNFDKQSHIFRYDQATKVWMKITAEVNTFNLTKFITL